MRCLGACVDATSLARRSVIPAGAIQPWAWSTLNVEPPSSAIDMIQLTGDPQCEGSGIVVVQGEASDVATIARIEWAQGPASYWALVDAIPGQAVDLLGGTAVRVSVGHVTAGSSSPWVSVGMQRRGRATHEVTLTTPSFEPPRELVVPPWARWLEVIGDESATLEWRALAAPLATAIAGRRAAVPGTASTVLVTGDGPLVARWILCL